MATDENGGKLGRPSKFTPEVIGELERNISAGLPYEVACKLSGIAYSTYRNWVIAAEGKDADPDLLDFLERVRRAETRAEATLIARWLNKTADDWRASRDYLARRWPERWASKMEIAGPQGGPVEHAVRVWIPHNNRDPLPPQKVLKE